MSGLTSIQSSPLFVGPQRPFVGPVLPQPAVPAAPATEADQVTLSAEAQAATGGPPRLLQFGGDRKHAIETLVASGAKAENPKLPWYKDVLRAFAGDKTKTKTTPISATQGINAKVKVKNFHLKSLRLTTLDHVHGRTKVLRHTDFGTRAPDGGAGEVKDIGQMIGKGKVRRMFEQTVRKPAKDGSDPGTIQNTYFDPKTGKEFLHTSERGPRIEKDKYGTYKTRRNSETYRQIDLLNGEGQVHQRYIFDYANKDVRLENLNAHGDVVGTEAISKKTDYWKLVDRLSLAPPSSQA